MGISTLVILAVLLVVPVFALSRLSTRIDGRILAGVAIAASVVAYFAYRSDKRRAEAGARRVPELTLHALELVGGWPGAFLAQRRFRHKTAKVSYQAVFWTIVLLHQLLAIDSLQGWRFARKALPARTISGTSLR